MCNRCNGKLASSDEILNIPLRITNKAKCENNNRRGGKKEEGEQ